MKIAILTGLGVVGILMLLVHLLAMLPVTVLLAIIVLCVM